jgi:hypothetical protein
LIEHQQLACEVLGFRWLSEPQRRALVRALRQELTRTRDRQQLLVFARRWLYDHQLIIMHERALRSIIVSATRQYEAALARSIHAGIDSDRLDRWREALVAPRVDFNNCRQLFQQFVSTPMLCAASGGGEIPRASIHH